MEVEKLSTNDKEVFIIPMGKPRMTQQDKWKKRPVVVRYWLFKDKLQEWANNNGFSIGDSLVATFVIPFPKSYYTPKGKLKKKHSDWHGKAHQNTPDIDNIAKAVMDALLKDDSNVHTLKVKKVWGHEGKIIFHNEIHG